MAVELLRPWQSKMPSRSHLMNVSSKQNNVYIASIGGLQIASEVTSGLRKIASEVTFS